MQHHDQSQASGCSRRPGEFDTADTHNLGFRSIRPDDIDVSFKRLDVANELLLEPA